MQMPFCDQCNVAQSCQQDLALFREITGNKRIPPESFCREQYARAGEEIGDFYRNVLVNAVDNPTCLYPVFPELREQMEQLEREWQAQRAKERSRCHSDGCGTDVEGRCTCGEQETFMPKLPLSVTLMLTERCNLACEYCYERFSGNVKPKTMSRAVVYQTVQKYSTREMLELHPQIQWDLIGGEVFAEFELLKDTVDTIINAYRQLGVCPKKIALSLCTNGTLFDAEKRAWCESVKQRVGSFDVGLSLDGIKECHDLCRNNSFDRVMEHFDWWKKNFPNSGIKGTISPVTLKYLSQNVRYYVEEAMLPRFYINPTFEGPWTDADAELYGEELIKCAEFFLARQDYDVLANSNLFAPVHIRMEKGPRKQNWCGCGSHMRAVNTEGTVYPCLRAVTSDVSPLGTLATGVDKQKLVPFFLYTRYNDEQECKECETAPWCPSCAMQWVEDTGDLFWRSKTLCTMTKVRHRVSQWFYEQTDAGKKAIAERQSESECRSGQPPMGEEYGDRLE